MTDQEQIASLRQQVETLKKDVSIWKASSEKWAQRHAEVHAQVETLTQERQDWRAWAQFTYLGGGPATGTDAELRAAVCTANDTEVRALHRQLASLAAAQERMTWQPIETAPCDGASVLGWFPYYATAAEGGHAYVMRWNDDRHAIKPRPFWEASGWVWGVRDNRAKQPTHWLALPSLAASSRETTKETKDTDARQSSPSPVREPGSPRSPQPKGSER